MSQSEVNEFLAQLKVNHTLMSQLTSAFGLTIDMADHNLHIAIEHMTRINAELLLVLHRIENPSQV